VSEREPGSSPRHHEHRHLEENLAAAQIRLAPAEVEEITALGTES
jgi:diketogulonate reductase-like aldo/keto reductase